MIYGHREEKEKLVHMIEECCNPFDSGTNDSLYNIFTGKEASSSVKESILAVKVNGEDRRKTFVEACKKHPSRFEQPIKREQLLTFQSECAKNQQKNIRTKMHNRSDGTTGSSGFQR